MKKIIQKTSLVIITLVTLASQAQTPDWWDLAEGQVSNAQPGLYQNIAFNKYGVAYVAFQYASSQSKTIVKKYNGLTWEAIGGANGFGAINVIEQKLVINSETNNPIVSYVNENVGNSQVLSFNGIGWSALGSTILGYGTVLALSPTNIPYIAFNNTLDNIIVQSFSGSNWNSVGTITGTIPALSRFTLVFSPSGVPFVSYTDNATTKLNVVSFNGSNWNLAGNANFSAGDNAHQSLAFNSTGTPFIAFQDGANLLKAMVMSLSGNNWVAVGNVGNNTTIAGLPSNNFATHLSLAFNNVDVPHLAFSRGGSNVVVRWNGTNWVYVDATPYGYGGSTSHQSMRFNPLTNEPWVAFNAPNLLYGTVIRYGINCLDLANATPTIIFQPESKTSCQTINETNTFSVTGAGFGLFYEWNNGVQGRVMTTSLLGNNYRVTVSGTCGKVTSSTVTHTNETPTSITSQPISSTVCGGATGLITVGANGGIYPVSYTWSSGLQGTNALLTSVPGTYNVTVVGACGTVISDYATLANTNTTINVQPVSQTVCKGTAATFAITASGENLTYKWANNTSTSAQATTTLAGNYMVTVTGFCGSVVSNTVSLITKETSIVSQPSSQKSCAGNSASFSVSALGENLVYNWSNGLSTTNSMVTSVLGTNYLVTVIGNCGTAISTVVGLTNGISTNIIAQPVSQIVCNGASSLFAVSAVGENLSYNWSNGASNFALMSTSIAGNYALTVSGACGNQTSSPFALINTICGSNSTITSAIILFPSNLATTFTGFAANLVWPTLAGANTYCIRYSKSSNFTSTVKTVCGLTASNYLFVLSTAGLRLEALDETFYYQVAGVDAAGNMSAWSATQSFELRTEEIQIPTSLQSFNASKFTISPNPYSNGELKVENGELSGNLLIYNAQGLVVYGAVVTSETTILNLSISKGMYLVKVGNQVAKLIVE